MKKALTWLATLLCVVCGLCFVAGCTNDPSAPQYEIGISETVQNGTLTADKSVAEAGETITVTATPDNGYVLDGKITVNGTEIEGNTFVMPSENVVLFASFKSAGYKVTLEYDGKQGTLSASATTAQAGTVITVTPHALQGYRLASILVGEEALTAQDGVYSFTMPAANVTVKALFEKASYSVTVADTDVATVSVDKTTANYGDIVTVSVENVAQGYEIDKILVNGKESSAVFSMPAENTTVTVTFKVTGGVNFGYSEEVPVAASAGWTLTGDVGEHPVMSVTSSAGELVYLKQAAADFVFETKINIADTVKSDDNPTTGIVVRDSSKANGLYFYVHLKDFGTNNIVSIMPANDIAAFEYQWSGVKIAEAGKAYHGEGNFITLGVAKKGAHTYFYLNGELVYRATYPELGITENCYVGLVSMGVASGTYYDYAFLTEAADITAKLGTDEITSAQAPAWTEGLESASVVGSGDYLGKGVTFYAQVVEGGVRVAAVATHSAYAYTDNNSGNWWKNTNLEMWSGSGHFYLTSRAVASDEGPLGRAFYTIYDDDLDRYTTVAEGFFTSDQIAITDGVARLSFAWKTPDDRCNNGHDMNGNASDWWLVPGHNGDAANQFYVNEEGLSATAPVKTYPVTVTEAIGGTVTASAAKAAEGTTVTLTVTPDEGYQVKAIKLGEEELTPVESVYSFDMPAANVTITAEFEKINYTITVGETSLATVTADKTSATFGETVTVTVTDITEGYELESILVNSAAIDGTSFTMPAANVTISVTFTALGATKYAVTISDTIVNGTLTANKTQAAEGEAVTLTVTPDTGYELDGKITVNGEEIEGLTFVMPAEEAVITAAFRLVEYTVTVECDNGTVSGVPEKATMGTEISFTVTPAAGYTVTSVTAGSETLTADAGTYSVTMPASNLTITVAFGKIDYTVTVETNENATLSVDKETANVGDTVNVTFSVTDEWFKLIAVKVNGEPISGKTFTMPAENVTVSIQLKQITGEYFGKSEAVPLEPSSGWTLSGDAAGANPALNVNSGAGELIYLKQSAADFVFETKINISELVPTDGNPTTGIVVRDSAKANGLYFYVRLKDFNVNNMVRIMPANNIAAFDYNWSGVQIAAAGKAYTGEGNFITLGVAKKGAHTYFYLNGELVYKATYPVVGTTENCYVGLVTMGVKSGTYFDYTFKTDAAAITEKLGTDEITSVQAPAWTAGLQSASVTGSDGFAGKGVTFYAQVVEGGVRVAAVATHSKYTCTEGNWWLNTNFEMFSGSKQYFLTAKVYGADNGPFGISFYTIYNSDTGLYTTVAEGFISDAQITITDGVARLGFAWKTPGDQCNNGNDGTSEYWLVPGHRANNAGEQFYITANGIFAEAPAAEEDTSVE